jgi:hypothetical protein
VLRSHRSTAVAVRPFSNGENSLAKARCAQEHFANPRNFDNVYPNGYDHKRY